MVNPEKTPNDCLPFGRAKLSNINTSACKYCGIGNVVVASSDLPYSERHWICESCESTYQICEYPFDIGKAMGIEEEQIKLDSGLYWFHTLDCDGNRMESKPDICRYRHDSDEITVIGYDMPMRYDRSRYELIANVVYAAKQTATAYSYLSSELLFKLLASIALTLPRNEVNPIGIMELLRGSLLPEDGFDDARTGVIAEWKKRRKEYPWHFPSSFGN